MHWIEIDAMQATPISRGSRSQARCSPADAWRSRLEVEGAVIRREAG